MSSVDSGQWESYRREDENEEAAVAGVADEGPDEGPDEGWEVGYQQSCDVVLGLPVVGVRVVLGAAGNEAGDAGAAG
jgi:hypothetical protein